MNRILEINPEMKTATVEPGVTFVMLQEQTRKYQLRPAFPDAPLTVSVLVNYYLRGIYQTSATDGHDHTISYEMILPNCETLKTGPRALFEMPYFRYGVGPDFAGMFCAHPGTCGVVTELRAKLYRLYDNRKEHFIGFDDVSTPTKFIYNLMNDELAASIRLVDNQSWLKGIFGTFDYPYEELPKFVLCVLVEGVDGVFEAKDKLVRAYMKECGGQVLELPAEFASTFEHESLGGADR